MLHANFFMPTGHVDTGYFISGNPETAPVLITGAQPKAGTGHKMQSVPVVFERYIVRDISLTYLLTSPKSTR